MFSDQQPSSSSNPENSEQSFLEVYEISMRKAISDRDVFEPKQLHAEHEKIVAWITEELEDEQFADITYLLNAQWCNIVEHEEEKIWKSGSQEEANDLGNKICMYITCHWLMLATTFSKEPGENRNIKVFPKSNQPGFYAHVGRSKGKLVWGYNYDQLTAAEKLTVENYDSLLEHITRAGRGNLVSREIVTEVFVGLKEFWDRKRKENISQAVLVVPSRLEFEERDFLRDCCKMAGFRNTALLNDSGLGVGRLFSTLSQQNAQKAVSDAAVVVVNVLEDFEIRLEIFDCGNEIDSASIHHGVKLLAVAVDEWSSDKQIFQSLYNRALEQTPVKKRNSIGYYLLLTDYPKLVDSSVDNFFQAEMKLKKVDNILEQNLLKVFPQSQLGISESSDDEQMENEEIFDEIDTNTPTDPKRGSFARSSTHGARLIPAELQLNICTLEDRKVYCIMVSTNWTVRKLKKVFQECRGQQDSSSFVIQYGSRLLNNDNGFLEDYQIEPDSFLQVTFISKGNLDRKVLANQLIADCIALYNGTEPEEVEGLTRGRLVLARTNNGDNLTMGVIGMTCKINGFGDVIYVSVNFQKQLDMGSTKVEHIGAEGTYCDRCKDGKSLFIARDLIGNSNRYLFQLQ